MAITIPGTSEPIGSVDYATNAGHATTADTATSATTAGHATTAGSANTATNAGHATTADKATSATSATSATNATNATSAASANIANHMHVSWENEDIYVKKYTISNCVGEGVIDITLKNYVPIGIYGMASTNQQIVLTGHIYQGDNATDDTFPKSLAPNGAYSSNSPKHKFKYWGYSPTLQSVSCAGYVWIMYLKGY